jgi:hypothetical protein
MPKPLDIGASHASPLQITAVFAAPGEGEARLAPTDHSSVRGPFAVPDEGEVCLVRTDHRSDRCNWE